MVPPDRPTSRAAPTTADRPLDAGTTPNDDEAGRLRTVAEAARDGIIVVDETNTIRFADPAVARILGRNPESLEGRPLGELVPRRLRAAQSRALDRYLRTGERTFDWDGVELPGLHADGHEVDLAVSFREVRDGDERYFVGFVRDVSGRTTRARELERYQQIVDAVGDGIYQLDLDGRFVWVNDVISEVTGYGRDELVGEPVSKVLDPPAIRRSLAVIESLVDGDGAVGVVEFDVRTASGEVVPTEARIALVRVDGDLVGTVGVVRDISERVDRKRQLEAQRDELEALDQINTLIRGVNRSLVGASTRAEIEETVCRRLSDSGLYRLAWIGDLAAPSRSLRPRAGGGLDEDGLRPIVEADAADGEETPAGRTLRTGERQVVRRIADDAEFSAAWRAAAIERGWRSMAAFPLAFGAATYGVLAVYAGRDRAFGAGESAVLGELAETVGLAINAVETRHALQADTVTAFELEVEDADHPFVELAAEVGCTLALEGTVPATDDLLVQYVSTSATSAPVVRDRFERQPAVRAARTVRETEEGCRLEVVSSAAEFPSIVPLLTDHGAKIVTVIADDGTLHVAGETARPTRLRPIVEGFRERFAGAKLAAVRECDRSAVSRESCFTSLETRLTDRQRAVLRAAYLGGYFKTSRDSTGTELAASLDISPATFHQHLQAGLGKVMGELFEPAGTG